MVYECEVQIEQNKIKGIFIFFKICFLQSYIISKSPFIMSLYFVPMKFVIGVFNL